MLDHLIETEGGHKETTVMELLNKFANYLLLPISQGRANHYITSQPDSAAR
jgi:hypothetical protein